MEKLADISTFENLQYAANRSMATQMSVFNAFSEEETDDRIAWGINELKKLQQEIQIIEQEAEMFGYGTEQDLWDIRALLERGDALDAWLTQLESEDTEGAFIDRCIDMKKQLNDFKVQVKSAIDKNPQRVIGLSNMALFD